MQLNDEDLQCAYYVNHRFLDPLRKAGKLGQTLESWYRKVDLYWEMSADGPRKSGAPVLLESAPLDTAEAAAILNVTRRQVRRLVNDLDGFKRGAVWLFPKQTVMDYAEGRRSG
jgi:excisionase family DNA binding protein